MTKQNSLHTDSVILPGKWMPWDFQLLTKVQEKNKTALNKNNLKHSNNY